MDQCWDLFFILHTADLIELIRSQGLCPHLYADDTQLYGSCRPVQAPSLAENVASCVDLVAGWMRSNRLQLNGDKTEVLWVASARRQHQLPTLPLTDGGQLVHPVRSVPNLGVFNVADLVMRSHVVSHCFALAAAGSSVRASVKVPCAGSDTAGLRQQYSGWPPS
jgi:hypothetical protein